MNEKESIFFSACSYHIGSSFFNTQKRYAVLYDKSRKIKEYGETSVETAEIYRKMGGASTSIDESFQYLGKAKDIFEGLGELCGLGRTYHFYATKCMDMDEREVGLKYLKQAEELYAKVKVFLLFKRQNYTQTQEIILMTKMYLWSVI